MRLALVLITSALLAQTSEQLRLAQQGKDYLAAGQFEAAIPVYDQLVKALPANPGLKLNLGIALHMAGRDPEAVSVLEPVSKLLPQAFPAFALLGASYMRLGQPAKAVAPLERAVQLGPEDPQARRFLADALLMLSRFGPARLQLEKLSTLIPNEPSVWFGLGRVYEELSRGSFEQLRRTAPESPAMLYLLAETREKQGRKASAEALYAKAKALSPKSPACPSPYCTIRAYDTKARESFSKLAALGDSVELRQTRAEILTNQNKHAEAAAEWRAALKIAAGRPDLEQGLATSLYAAQQFDEAEALLKHLVKGEPGNPELHFLLGDCLLQKGDSEAAVPALRRAYTLNPKFPPARSTLGRALLATGKAADAIPHLEASLPFDDDGTTHFQLSRAYTATGQTAKAEAAAKRSQELRQ